MSFSLGWSPVLLVVAVLAAAGLTVWSYRNTVPPLSGWRKWLPATLRFVALTIITFLLLEPVVQSITKTERPPILAVLVDDSESLNVTARSSESTENVQTTSGDGNASGESDASNESGSSRSPAASLLPVFEQIDGSVRYFSFDRTLRDLGTAPAESLTASGSRTNLSAALDAVRSDLNGENLAGVVVVSDGQYNAGRNPLYVAERYPVSIHTVTLGDTTGARDVQIRRVTTNDLAYVGTELPVRVALRSSQAGGEQVTVRLQIDGETLDQKTVRLPSGTGERGVDLAFTPETPGLQPITVSVTPLNGEATNRNNAARRSIRVLESKRRVFLLAGAPSPDVGALRRVLERDADTDLTVRVTRQDGRYYGGTFPKDFSEIDVLVLMGFPGPATRDADIDRVADALDEGLPVVFFMQANTDLGRLSSLTDALPVAVDRPRSSSIEALIDPTEQALQHPVMQVENAENAPWDQLPPLQYNESRWTLSPDARTLATLRVRGMSIDDPALVIRRRAGQRSAALLAHGTWRWTNLPDDLAAARPVWPGVLSNLVRWVAAREDNRPVRVDPVQDVFAGGERVELTGQVYDESLEPVSDATVDVTVRAEDGTEYDLSMDPRGNGQYGLDAGVLPEGTYAFEATGRRDGSTLGTDQGRFSVGELTVEYRETRADAALMRQLAERSGGQAFTADAIDGVPAAVQEASGFRTSTFEAEREFELWRLWGFLVAILVCLAGEWTLRKRFGLV